MNEGHALHAAPEHGRLAKSGGDSAILALDFDGVMHPFGCGIDRYLCHLPLLEAWLRQRPHIDVVISSSWREHHPLDEIQSYFSDDVSKRIVGMTPVIWRSDWAQVEGELLPMRFERETEILRWLHESDQPWRKWVALDDQPWLFRPFCPNLTVCDGATGLTEHEFELADAALVSQRP